MSTELTINEASVQLGISAQHIRSLCRQGTLNCRRVGTNWLIEKQSLDAFALSSGSQIVCDHPTSKRRINKPVALSFFSGAMGLDQGIEASGFDIRLACEVDKYCRQTIELNRPNIALIGDVNLYSANDVLRFAGLSRDDEVGLICGGPPCQAFSTAGKRKGFNDERGNVFLKFLEIAFDIRPRFLVIENVRGLLSCPMTHRPHQMRGADFPDLQLDELPGGALNFVLSLIRNNGYAYSFNLYNAANFGTPQSRERVVIICSRDGAKPPFLVPTHSQQERNGLLPWKSFRKATKGIKEHHHLNFPEKRLRFYRMLKEGQNWRSLPPELQQEALGNAYFAGGGKTGFLRRLAWDKPSPTVVTHPAMPATDLAHPEEDRPLSIEEYKRLQEFSDEWLLAGPLTEQYKQVGNAVPASLGRAIGDLVISMIDRAPINMEQRFQYSRYKNTSDKEWEEDFARISHLKSDAQPALF